MTDKPEVFQNDLENHELACKNCGTPLAGPYCSNCGQSDTTFDKPFRFLIADFAGNIFAFDTRLWNTIKTILTKPGGMARDIMEGKRARYMPPFRLYVFVSFIFFLILANTAGLKKDNMSLFDKPIEVTLTNDSLDTKETVAINTVIDSLHLNEKPKKYEFDLFGKTYGLDFSDIQKHPDRYFSQFLRWTSISMFFLMPFYGFLLWLFFRKTVTHYFGHLILAINQHVFTFLIFSLLMLFGLAFPHERDQITPAVFLGVAVYYFLVQEGYISESGVPPSCAYW